MAYAVDRLGFLQFEQLWERALALELGLDPGDWHGHADATRSALHLGSIGPPLTVAPLPGPVLVQCAWIRPGQQSSVIDVVAALRSARPGACAAAASYLLLTNVEVGPTLVNAFAKLVGDDVRRAAVFGPEALGDQLDARPQLRLEMPSTLGLRDLGPLIDPSVAERSTLDRAAAEQLARVFVPTSAYRRALVTLAAHRFCVLTGPPEMGKTAIARVIGLARLTDGWEAHECLRPEDLWECFEPSRRQLFIADDAFGSTEYRPDRADRWARELERILRALDDRHWLIWTSRPAPLQAGLRRLHRERGAERFPSPGRVLVDASELDGAEKTLILFRHAKAAELPAPIRAEIRALGVRVVAHRHFTPERIRRFVAALSADGTVADDVYRALGTQLTRSTEAMAMSFAALAPEHRDLLVAMLDTAPGPVDEHALTDALRRHHDGGLPQPPAELVDRLTDHFLRVLP